MGIRRVVTGHSKEGKAIVASDEVVEPLTFSALPGSEFYRLWGADEPLEFPDDGAMPQFPAYFPPLGGFRFGLFTVPPAPTSRPPRSDIQAARAEIEEKLPGLSSHMEPDNPGMHTTATIDYEYVLSGSVVLELDDGTEVEVSAGDTIVQNGTRHAWRNRSSEPCTMLVVLVGAKHDQVG